MTDCHVGFVDPQMFDPANPGQHALSLPRDSCCCYGRTSSSLNAPGGTYTLDLEDKYSRTVLQNMAVLQVGQGGDCVGMDWVKCVYVRVTTALLQLRGNGSFASGTVRLDDKSWSIPTGTSKI
jgi:hypothetical protein